MAKKRTTKLTLAIDASVVRRAKLYASTHSTTVSGLVESYLRRITAEEAAENAAEYGQLPPVTQSLLGALTSSEGDEIDADRLREEYLADKYLHD